MATDIEKILEQAMKLKAGQQVVLSFSSAAERQSKRVLLYNKKKELVKKVPLLAKQLKIRQVTKGNSYLLTVTKEKVIPFGAHIVDKDGTVSSLTLPEGQESHQVASRIAQCIQKEKEKEGETCRE